MTEIEIATAEQNLWKSKTDMDAYIMSDFTNLHDCRRAVGMTLRKLESEGKIKLYSSKEAFKFSDQVASLTWDYTAGNKPPARAMDLRRAACYFATLADAFAIIEKNRDKTDE